MIRCSKHLATSLALMKVYYIYVGFDIIINTHQELFFKDPWSISYNLCMYACISYAFLSQHRCIFEGQISRSFAETNFFQWGSGRISVAWVFFGLIFFRGCQLFPTYYTPRNQDVIAPVRKLPQPQNDKFIQLPVDPNNPWKNKDFTTPKNMGYKL